MGIIVDGRKFNSKKSPDKEFDNAREVRRFVYTALDTLNGYENSFKLNKNSLVIKGEGTRFSGDPTLKTLTIKGSFEDVDPDDQKTWKSAKVEKIRYKGKEGIIDVRETGNKGSLGSLYDWANIERIDEYLFRGDDIVYSSKINSGSRGGLKDDLEAYGGDDTFYVYKNSDVEGGKGKDKTIVTKEAINYFRSINIDGNETNIAILDANSRKGDAVKVLTSKGDISFQVYNSGSRTVQYASDKILLFVDYINEPVFADFGMG